MRNYIILNNKNSNTISGLIIQELAPISKPQQRTQVETIDGRDGDIVTPLGYAAYNKKIKIGLYGDFDINEIIAYFATQGTAIFSNEPDKYYNYQILDQIDYERLVRYRVATVTMHVQPFKYSATEGTLTIDASDTVSGEGSEIALDNTAEAPFNVLRHKGNAIQDGTPTPDNPIDVKVSTGEQTIKITGKNLINQGQYGTNQTTYGLTADFAPDKITLKGTSEAGSWPAFAMFANGHLEKTRYWPTAAQIVTSRGAFNDEGTYRFAIYVNGTRGTVNNDFRYIIGYMDGTVENRYFPLTDYSQNIGVTKPINFIAIGTQPNVTANCSIQVQLEKSTTASKFEPYKEQLYKLNLGKNLFNSFGENSSAITVEADGSIKISGVSSANGYCSMGKTLAELAPTLKVGDTVYLYLETDWSGKSIYIAHGGYWQNGVAKTITQDMLNDTVIVYGGYQTTTTIKIMITKTLDTDYAPYFTPIELVGIGDYADEPVKVGDTWYIRRAIGKVVLDGSSDETFYSNTYDNYYRILYPTTDSQDYPSTYRLATDILSSHFAPSSADGYGIMFAFQDSVRGNCIYFFPTADITDMAGWRSWLASNPTTVYYVLATPTDEEVTNQALIDQLDDIYEQAHSYKGRTHITANAQGDNAPAVLSVEVGENNESTVTNAGNTTSRPIITIYGQGNIGMYINDVQVLDIALGDEQYITIDSVAMEAYKDTTENLKNRLVTGDYNKLALNAGANKIYFTGNVTKYEISKYSRWL